MSLRPTLSAVVAWGCLFAAPSWAQAPVDSNPWRAAFQAVEPSQWAGVSGLKVLVAAAGQPVDEVRAAAEALRATLRGSASAALVMDDSPLGSLSTASDEEVRRKAAALPWDRLLVVRTFPGAEGQRPSAVVVVFDQAGTARHSLVVPQAGGAASAPPPLPPPPPMPAPVKQLTEAEKAYEARRLRFGQTSLVSKDPGVLLQSGVYQGNRRLESRALYEVMKRADFLERMEARSRLRLGIGLAGGGLMALGATGLVLTAASGCVEVQHTSNGPCLQRSVPNLTVPSLITAGVGLVGVVVAVALPADPVGAADVVPAIESHNAALRKEVGLSLRLTPAVTPDGLGVSLAGRF